MKSKPVKKPLGAKVGQSFYVTGFQDYLGARVLLNRSLLLQGATLASTAVEKYLKAFMAARGVQAFGHVSDWSPKDLSKLALETGLNEDFLGILQIVYRLRYLDELREVVSFSIERLKFLAELDHTVAILNGSMGFKRDKELIRPYDGAREISRPELLQDNWVLAGMERSEFLARPDIAEAFYIDESLEILSCVVTGWIPQDFVHFCAPGIVRRGATLHCILGAATT